MTQKRLAIFDFDGTLYPGRSLPFLCLQYKDFSPSRRRYYGMVLSFGALYLLYKTGILAGERSKERALVRFIHLFRGEREERIAAFFTAAYRHMRQRLCAETVKEAGRLKRAGYTLVLVSGACKPLLDRVAADLGFDLVIGTNVPVKGGRFDTGGAIVYVNGTRKVPLVLDAVASFDPDLANSYAYADSFSDLPLLELVGNPVAVRPDRRLRQVAQERNWRIIGRTR